MEREFPNPILPEEEVAKDPQILNNGDNDAFVFLEVKVPYANVVTAKDDGIKNSKQDTQLFNWDVNENWVLVGSPSKSESDGTITYVYGYVGDNSDNQMEALSPSDTTPPLFTHVRFANVVEDQGLENTKLDTIINAYATQTTNINDNDTRIDGNNSDGKTTVGDVWDVVAKQTGGSSVSGGEVEEASTYSVKFIAQVGNTKERLEGIPLYTHEGQFYTNSSGEILIEGLNFNESLDFAFDDSMWDPLDGERHYDLYNPLTCGYIYSTDSDWYMLVCAKKNGSSYSHTASFVEVYTVGEDAEHVENTYNIGDEYSDYVFFNESERCLYIIANNEVSIVN